MMIVKIPDVMTAEDVQQIREQLASVTFVDGKLTAGWHAKLVKRNQQLPANSDIAETLQACVRQALVGNAIFQAIARPRVLHSILFSRYEPGMSYGTHVDNAYMGQSLLRSDLSFTLFLSDPNDYTGGELVLEFADSEEAYKLGAGTALVYPSTMLHRVNEVMVGQRLVAVGWVQSLIRDANEREILFDLDTARRAIFARSGKTDEFDLISKSLANLLRKWGD